MFCHSPHANCVRLCLWGTRQRDLSFFCMPFFTLFLFFFPPLPSPMSFFCFRSVTPFFFFLFDLRISNPF